MGKTIEITHPNGYKGILYGRSSMVICDKNGKEVLHTGFRTINTEEELREELENFPKFLASLDTFGEDDDEDDDPDAGCEDEWNKYYYDTRL